MSWFRRHSDSATTSAVPRDVPVVSGASGDDRWVAIDFETATAQRGSACAVGLVAVQHGQIVDSFRALIQPPDNHYDPFNIVIHGIAPADTANAPTFSEVWPEIEGFVGGSTLVAHNAGFDIGVLRAQCWAANVLPARDLDYACTLVSARVAWPGLPSYSLPWVCDHLGIDLADHHDAIADASACAMVGLRLLENAKLDSWPGTVNGLRIRMGRFGTEDIRCVRQGIQRVAPDANPEADPDGPLYGVEVVFTGTLMQWTRRDAWALAADCGAIIKRNVTKNTGYLICGIQDPTRLKTDGMSGKMRKALALGEQVSLLTEVEFTQML